MSSTDLVRIVADGRRVLAATAPSLRIAVAGDVTTELLTCALACAASAEGIAPAIHQAPFGAQVQEIIDPHSALWRFRPDLVVLVPDWHALAADLPPIDSDAVQADAWIEANAARFAQLWMATTQAGAGILQCALVPPATRFAGPAERLAPASPARLATALNHRLWTEAAGRVHWIELDALAAGIGLVRWEAARFYASAKLPFDPRFLPDLLPLLGGALRSALGRVRRALVLDLDNTLWGGVIGDDGVDGILLGPASPAGEAFAAWGRYLAGLRARGVALAVCSRNDEAIARSAFAHPHSVLRAADFAAFACAWTDKVQGLRRVAAELNLGLDTLVFADDNPAECAMVQQMLPEVGVVCLGADPSAFIRLLERGRWFDAARYTTADLMRGEAFSARRAAEAMRTDAGDVGSFLAGLAMVGRIGRPEPAQLPRLAQLEQKTNQFNPTTRRHGEAALATLLARPDTVMLALSLSDRFGDHGLVSSLVALPDGDALRIDSWVMSCRVFARSAEAFMLRALLDTAHARGFARLLGEYRATARNVVVADLFARLGFAPRAGTDGFWDRRVVSAAQSGLPTWIS